MNTLHNPPGPLVNNYPLQINFPQLPAPAPVNIYNQLPPAQQWQFLLQPPGETGYEQEQTGFLRQQPERLLCVKKGRLQIFDEQGLVSEISGEEANKMKESSKKLAETQMQLKQQKKQVKSQTLDNITKNIGKNITKDLITYYSVPKSTANYKTIGVHPTSGPKAIKWISEHNPNTFQMIKDISKQLMPTSSEAEVRKLFKTDVIELARRLNK